MEVLLTEELQFILLNQFISLFIDQQSFPVGVDVVKDRVVGIFDGLDPTVKRNALALECLAVSLAHHGT